LGRYVNFPANPGYPPIRDHNPHAANWVDGNGIRVMAQIQGEQLHWLTDIAERNNTHALDVDVATTCCVGNRMGAQHLISLCVGGNACREVDRWSIE